jgi:hypothetical protein
MTIKLSNWSKRGCKWLNNLSYAVLGTALFVMAGDSVGFNPEWLTDKTKQIIGVTAIVFKFIEKLTANEKNN